MYHGFMLDEYEEVEIVPPKPAVTIPYAKVTRHPNNPKRREARTRYRVCMSQVRRCNRALSELAHADLPDTEFRALSAPFKVERKEWSAESQRLAKSWGFK